MKKLRVGIGVTRIGCGLVLFGMALLLGGAVARAQDSSDELNLAWEPGSHVTAEAYTVYHHARAANTPAGRSLRAKELANAQAPKKNAAASAGGILQFPGDVTYQGGPVVDFAQFHAIYLLPNGKCPIATCWGDPEGFLQDLGKSYFIHLADQYIGFFGSDRYTVGERANVSYKPPKVPLTDADVEFVVHLVASALGDTGYRHIYHVFLPPGQDQCLTSEDTECYSPDNPNAFFYCGYHSSVDFSDIGHVLYTVEPYQNVSGCSLPPGTPNGMLVDSTNSILSHESFETITDPDGDAWFNTSQLLMFGAEIADECEFVTFVGNNTYFNPPIFRIHGTWYSVQSEYSNSVHACGTEP
jgi:hypothetical protein